jgi:hypothetical protein
VIGLDGVSAQALSDTIGAIYDCALDPQQWPATCGKIAALCESSAGGICVHDMRHVQNDQLFVFGYEPEFLEKLGEHYAQSPMAASDVVADIGEVSALSMERDELVESRFFRDVLEPFARSACSSCCLRMSAACSPSPMRSISGRCGRRRWKGRWMGLSQAFSSRHAMVASST